MRHRHAVLALPLVTLLLAGCAGTTGAAEISVDESAGSVRGGEIPMTTYRDRMAAEEAAEASAEAAEERAAAAEDAREALSTCGDPDDDRTFDVSAAGAELQVTVPADASDDPVADLEDLREDAGGAPVCWVVVSVDNADGSAVVDVPMISVTAADGGQVPLQRASSALSGWSDLRPDDEDLTARVVELVAASDGVVGPGDEGDLVFVAESLLEDPRGVRLQLTDGGSVVSADR